MLLQSHEENLIRILPALPAQWINGHINGLKARGNITVDISWKNNQLEEVKFYSPTAKHFTMIYNKKEIPVSIKAGEIFIYKR